jgi:hypothetical protein
VNEKKENSEILVEKNEVVPLPKKEKEEKKSEADKLQEDEIERLNFRFTRYYSPVR